MGSLILPPKAPNTQTIIKRVPVASTTVTPSNNTSDSTDSKSSDVLSSEARAENLLRRGRGRFGTILTGFKGALEPNSNNQKRKTLLGE